DRSIEDARPIFPKHPADRATRGRAWHGDEFPPESVRIKTDILYPIPRGPDRRLRSTSMPTDRFDSREDDGHRWCSMSSMNQTPGRDIPLRYGPVSSLRLNHGDREMSLGRDRQRWPVRYLPR